MTLKISISGVRGIVGDSLTEDVISDFAAAFSKYLNGGKVIVGSDARQSFKYVKDIVISALCRNGSETMDIGIAPTPTVQLYTRAHSAAGGIVVTASHNPPEWNGLKFIAGDGIFLNEIRANELIAIYGSLKGAPKPAGKHEMFCAFGRDALKEHVNAVLGVIDAEAVRKKAFKVAIDCCCGAGSVITQELLRLLNCEIFAINTDTSLVPKRGLEPVPGNLGELCRVVKSFGADIGFAQDPDADRLAIVSDAGEAAGEEYSLALASDYILSKVKKSGQTVVTNLSTSRMIDDVAKKHGASVIRTKVGEVNVSEKMKETKAVIGGEGNGGIIYPPVGLGRDSISGMGLMLDMLASKGAPLTKIMKSIPSYSMIKDRIELNDPAGTAELLEKVRVKFKGEKMDDSDGIKLDLGGGWVHIRPSNTEPIVRIIAEGKSRETAKQLIEDIKALA